MKRLFTIKINQVFKTYLVILQINFLVISAVFSQTYYSNFTTNAASHQVSTPTQIVVGIPPFAVNVDIGSFTNASRVADDPITNYSSYSNAIGLSLLNSSAVNVKADLNLGTSTSLPSGSVAGFVIDNTASLINISVANTVTISTYLNGTLQESSSTTNPLSVTIFLGDTIQDFHFTTTKSFNQVSVNIGSGIIGASLFQEIRFYYAYGTAKAVLPVFLQSFIATPQNGIVKLNWITATETNNKGFAIERSIDGINFSQIAFNDSKAKGGNSTSAINYTATDATPLVGVNYYRLKQVDFDGYSSYSNIELVNITGLLTSLNVFPNPATNLINIQVSTPGSYQAELFNISGQKLQASILSTSANLLTFNFNKSNLQSGMYLVKITNVNGKSKSYYNTVLIK